MGVPLIPHQEKENFLKKKKKSKNPALTMIKFKQNTSLVISFSQHCQGWGERAGCGGRVGCGRRGAAAAPAATSQRSLCKSQYSDFSLLFPVPQVVASPCVSPYKPVQVELREARPAPSAATLMFAKAIYSLKGNFWRSLRPVSPVGRTVSSPQLISGYSSYRRSSRFTHARTQIAQNT